MPGARLTAARPKATTAEKTIPMAASEESAARRCTAMTANPTRMPKMGMASRGSTDSMRPRAAPAKAEWPMASEKKAMRKCTTCTPRAAVMGQRSSRPINACRIKCGCRQSRGMAPHSESSGATRGVQSGMASQERRMGWRSGGSGKADKGGSPEAKPHCAPQVAQARSSGAH